MSQSWFEIPDASDFPLENLPLGRGRTPEGRETFFIRIGDHAIDLGLLQPDLTVENLDVERFRAVRSRAHTWLTDPANRPQVEPAMIPVAELEMLLPLRIPAFVDFYSGIHHASNVGRMFRPEMDPLLPNYRHLPVGYNGRASTVMPSGVPVVRPQGQTKAPNDELPKFGPTKEMDFELELGFFLGQPNASGQRIDVNHAENSILGVVLVNDWSARDVQRWEYQPLGPFLAKSFATSISPWIVSLDALEPFRVAGQPQDPAVLPHLSPTGLGHFDIQLEVLLKTAIATRPQVICHSNARHLYWTFAQQLAHQASNGTRLEVGDLYATGTISGPEAGTFGSMLELTWRGSQPLTIEETGETRTFLADGDIVTMRGFAEKNGLRIGLGEVSAEILPAN